MRLSETGGHQKEKITLHTLRHSYATQLHEEGQDIRNIQELLGHQSPKTTMIYTNVSNHKLRDIKSPIEKLLGGKKDE